jgi:holo-[acyl-carrier-protein] synthase
MAVEDEGVVASTVEVLEIDEVKRRLAQGEDSVFTKAERAYARSKSDPERRLAARLAAKRASCRLLGGDVTLADIEVVRDCAGPPGLRFSARARRRMESLGAARALVSLSHERRHAAAAVVLLRGTE